MEYDLYNKLQRKQEELDLCIKKLRPNGDAFAEAERDYYTKKASESLKLQESGMAVSMIALIIKGIKSVADARFKMQIAETIYKANQEAINAIKLEMKLIEAQISREWGAND